MKKEGISLIALIITIVVLIILASITIFSGLNTPTRAGFAKFATEISDIETAVMEKYSEAESQGIIQGKVKSPEQIYYCIANDLPISSAPASPAKTDDVSNLGTLYGEGLKGTEYYEMNNSNLIPANKTFYGDEEAQYITNAGEIFILPGYKVEEGNETRWYIDEKTYYVGEAKEIAQSTNHTLASMNIEVGDFVTYTGDGSYTLLQSKTGISNDDASDEGYIDGEKPISAENITWRVWNIQKDINDNITSIVIMPTSPVNSIHLSGAEGFTNSVDIIEAVCDMYKNDSLGVTVGDVESLKIGDLEDTRVSSNLASTRDNFANSNSSTGKYGGTKTYTSGTFYTEEDGVTINKSGRPAPATVTQTYYYMSGPSWNSCGNTKSGLTSTTYGTLLGSDYGWLASPCTYLNPSSATFYMHVALSSDTDCFTLVGSDGGTDDSELGVRPLVTLSSTLQVAGGSGTSGAPWQLSN